MDDFDWSNVSVPYIVYSSSSGEILRSGVCPGSVLTLQADENAGEVVVAGVASALTHHVVDGEVVEYSTAVREAKASRPYWATGWNNSTMEWVDPRTLEDRKLELWAAVKHSRDQIVDGGFTWDSSPFQSDAAKSQGQIQGAALAATLAVLNSQPFSITWTLTDNTTRVLSAADMIAVGQAMLVHIGGAYDAARVIRDQINAAQTIEELEAIDTTISN